MPTGARRRRVADVRRIGAAVSFPGIDPRDWVAGARVDVDPDAVSWDAGGIGHVVDVTFFGGGLDQLPEVPVRVLRTLAGDGYGESTPVAPGCEAIVAMPAGDPEANPVLLGVLHNADDCKAPTMVHGLPIDPEALQSSPTTVSVRDTEFRVSPYARREEYAGLWWVKASRHVLQSDDVRLGADGATEPALLGQVTIDNTNELLQALSTLAADLAALTSAPLTPIGQAGGKLVTALQTLSPKIAKQAAKKVKLE